MALLKKKKNYAKVMSSFTQVVTDLQEISDREESNIEAFIEKRNDINSKIDTSEAEMKNCKTAIDNVRNIFPNV